VDALPGVVTETPSFVTVAGEVAVSKPTPNQAGQAYIEEFEAEASRFLPLAENAWRWGSMPASPRGAEPFGIAPFGFDPLDAAVLTWQNVPYNPNGQAVLFYPQQIDPTIRVTGSTQNAEPVLWLLLKPDTVLGSAHWQTGAPNWVRPSRVAPRWRSLTLPLAAGGLDLSRVEFLEFWMWEDNRRVAKGNGAALLIDVGAVFEDALAWVPTSFTVLAGDTTYDGQRFVGAGRLDTERDAVTQSWNAAINDNGILGDRVVDGIFNATAGATVDTLPLCSLTLDGRLYAYGFGDLRSRCGRNNGFVDTEDQDGDFALDSATGVRRTEDFVRFVFPIGDERYFVREGGMITVRDSLGNPDGAAGWRLYRIPFRFDTLQVGTPNLRQVQAVRVTIVAPQTAGPGQPDPQIYFALSRVQFVGSTWLKRADAPQQGLAGTVSTSTGEVVASVVSTEDVELGYVPPPGVSDQADRRDAGLQIGAQQINEKSLRLLARGLGAGDRAEAYLRFTTEGDKNFLRYRTLRLWARGRGPGWDDRDLEFFVKVGKNERNFYLYRTAVRSAAWEPEVVVELERWVVLRAQIEQAWLSGAPAAVGAGCPDSTLLPPLDSAYVRCDGPYIAYIHDPGTAPPNLAQVQEIATGILRVTDRVFVDVAELWVDDIRLADVVDDIGIAGALDVSVSAGGVADLAFNVSRRDGQFGQLGDDPSYVTDDAWSASGTVRLDRFLPEQWGLSVPVTARLARTSSAPFYLARTDVRADVLDGLRTPASRAESYSVALRRVRRSPSPLGRWLLDPAAVSMSWSRGTAQTDFSRATASAYAVNFDYGITPAPATVGVAGRRVRWSPTGIRFRSNLTASEAERFSYQVQVARPADSLVTPARSLTRGWRNAAGVDFLPLTGVQLRLDGDWYRDLRDYGDTTSMGQVIATQRATFLGMDVGVETQRSLRSTVAVTTQIGGWLRPRVTTTSTFSLTRDPTAQQPVRTVADTAGAFRIPTAFTNQRRTDVGAQVELRGLAAKAFGDSARATRLLGRLQPVDVVFGRDLRSTYHRTGLDPSLGFELGLVSFDDFRRQGGVLAASASDNTSLSARSGVTLPLRVRVTVDYQLTRGETWTLRSGEQVPVRTRNESWPAGSISWSVTPRRLIGRLLTSVSLQAGYRETAARTEQPSLGGTTGGSAASVNSGTDRTFTPSATITWAGGVLTAVDASSGRNDQFTAGNRLHAERDTRNATIAFSFRPGFLLPARAAVRTTLRYTRIGNAQCIQSPSQPTCVPYVNSRQTSTNLTMDTDIPPNIGAGLQVSYVLNEERQINRKTSQLVFTAFISFATTVGQIQ
jgi:hypothetical protein